MAATKEHDSVNHPSHYMSRDIYIPCECGASSHVECIAVTRHFNFNLGNAIKYIWRADYKQRTIEDLKKAVWYIQDEIKQREKVVESNNRQTQELVKEFRPYTCSACHLTFPCTIELDNHWLLCHDSQTVSS